MSHFMLVIADLPFHYRPGPEAQNSAVRFPFSFASSFLSRPHGLRKNVLLCSIKAHRLGLPLLIFLARAKAQAVVLLTAPHLQLLPVPIQVDAGEKLVKWNLPCSKVDWRAVGATARILAPARNREAQHSAVPPGASEMGSDQETFLPLLHGNRHSDD